MLTNFIVHGRATAAAFICAVVCCNGSLAAEPAVNAEAYAPLLTQHANGNSLRFAQVTPAPGVAPVQGAAPTPNAGAQPGQSTIPSPSSSPGTPPPIQGAQPGQSTIPSPGSMPTTPPAPGAAGRGTTTEAGAMAPGGAPGVGPTFQQPAGVVVPRVPVGVPGQVVVPPQQVVVPPGQVVEPPTDVVIPEEIGPGPAIPPSPFLEDETEEMPVLEERNGEFVEKRVRPYGGGHPTDWWGCNGSPYRTGPGLCDDWRVGPRWHITVDGFILSREDADLAAIHDQMPNAFPPLPSVPFSNPPTTGNGIGGPPGFTDPTFENFDKEGGARIAFTSQVARNVGWDMQVVYEGVPEWNSSIVYPKLSFEIDAPPDPPGGFPLNPVPQPPDPFPEGFLQRSLHYKSSLNSLEMNALKGVGAWRPMFGIRYIRFDDEINDFIENETQPPLAGPRPDANPIGPSIETDRLNLFDIQNNLIGAQVGLLHDTWKVNRRLAIEGRINGGVYYNRIKYTNIMGTFTTQTYADNTSTAAVNEARVDFSDIVNNDVREYSEVSYSGEASLTGICRLNKCWAVRAGYQVLWIANVHTAEDAYLGDENVNDDLLFHGWHAGIECRR